MKTLESESKASNAGMDKLNDNVIAPKVVSVRLRPSPYLYLDNYPFEEPEPEEEDYLIIDCDLREDVKNVLDDIAGRLLHVFAFWYLREIGPTMFDVIQALDYGEEGKHYWTRVANKDTMRRN